MTGRFTKDYGETGWSTCTRQGDPACCVIRQIDAFAQAQQRQNGLKIERLERLTILEYESERRINDNQVGMCRQKR